MFDGHGPYGHDASDYVTNNIPKHFIENLTSGMDIQSSLKKAFTDVHNALLT